MSAGRKNSFRIGLIVSLALVVSCDINDLVDPAFKNYFIKYYGEDGDQEGKDLLVNNDGTLIILGTSTSVSGQKRIYMVKTDMEGEMIWEKKLGSFYNEETAMDIELITSGVDAGNFVVLSNAQKNIADSMAIRLTVITPDGDSLKSILFNQLESQEGRSVTPLSDGGFYVTGKTTDTNAAINVGLPVADLEDALIIRFQSNWNFTQVDQIGSSYLASGVKIFETGADFFYAGYSNEWNQLVTDDLYDLNFTFRSLVTTGTPTGYCGSQFPDDEELSAIARSPSDNYLAIGTQTLVGGAKKLYAGIVNNSFVTIREDDIEDDVEAVAATATGQGQFLVVGNKIGGGGNRNIWLAKVNVLLNLTTTPLSFGGPNNDDTASAVAELPNGDIVVLGTMNLVNQNKIALIKLRSNGQF